MRLFHEGKFEEILAITTEVREAVLADPLGSFRDMMASAPDADRAIMEDPAWQRALVIGVSEALRQGPGGWYDEDLAVEGLWGIDFAAITTDVTWWHGDRDSNAPLSAARRVIDALPSARAPRLAGCRPSDAVSQRARDP